MHLLLDMLALVRALSADRARLALEYVVLRQQLNVLRHSVKRARLNDGDRILWVLIHRLFQEWKEHLVIVKPASPWRQCWRWSGSQSMRERLQWQVPMTAANEETAWTIPFFPPWSASGHSLPSCCFWRLIAARRSARGSRPLELRPRASFRWGSGSQAPATFCSRVAILPAADT